MVIPIRDNGDEEQGRPNGGLASDWFEKLAARSSETVQTDIFENSDFIRTVKQASVGDFLGVVVTKLGVVAPNDVPAAMEHIRASEAAYHELQQETSPQEMEAILGLTGTGVSEGAVLDVAFFALREALQDRYGLMYEQLWNEAHRFARFVVAEALDPPDA